jgi:TonB family protein
VTPAIGPAVFGVRRPRLLVPRWLLDLDTPHQTLALQHEQEHARARDPQLLLLCAIACALVPWNVGAWWIARRLRLAMELDCDARVLRSARDAGRYGRLLLFMAERQSRMRLASMLAESNSHLSRRIRAMNASRPTNPMLRAALLAIGVAGALACSAKYGNDLVTAPTTPGSATTSAAQAASIPYYSPEGAKPVAQRAGSAAPRYPANLRTAHVEGEVLVSFVVDTSGLVMPGSLRVARSTDDLFADAVRATESGMRFAPAELNGRKVRQLVQQLFFFNIADSPASKARKPAPVAVPSSDPANRNPMMLSAVVITGTP